MSDTTAILATAALDYAAAGQAVFPLHSARNGSCSCGKADCPNVGKHPRSEHGFLDASTDVQVIAEWWRRWPDANIGIATGAASGLDVLDVDTPKGGAGSLAQLERAHGKLPQTREVLTGSGGRHLCFLHDPERPFPTKVGDLGEGLDTRGNGGYVVAPPSGHESGRPYKVIHERAPVPAPVWLTTLLLAEEEKRRNGPAPKIGEVIPDGERNDKLTSLAGTMRRRGMSEQAIVAALLETNRGQCQTPLPEDEVRAIAKSIAKKSPAEPLGKPVYTGPAHELQEVVATFRKWLHLPDPGALYAMLAAVVANRQSGDPVWLLLVGASGAGKTELLSSLGGLEEVFPAAVLTEASLLSGTPRKDSAADARGGLLLQVGEYGILTMKDFGSVLSMHRDARASVLAALREIYDGSWTRHVGTDGGRTLHWGPGKLGLIAGCTPTLDRHHAVMAALGERFALYRLGVDDPKTQSQRALTHLRHERGMRSELRNAVAGLFAGLVLPEGPPELSESDVERLLALANLVTKARSPVERDTYVSREIELVPDSEVPGRLVVVLANMLEGLRAIGLRDREAWPLVVKIGLDSMPAQRRNVLEHLLVGGQLAAMASTKATATALDLPTNTVRRTLEDLTAHGVLCRESGGEGKSDTWAVADWARLDYACATVPEMSQAHIPPSLSIKHLHVKEDISGKPQMSRSLEIETAFEDIA